MLRDGDSDGGCRLGALFTLLGQERVSRRLIGKEAAAADAAPLRAVNVSLPNPDAPSSDAAVLSGCQAAFQAIDAAYDAHAWVQLPEAAALFPQLSG